MVIHDHRPICTINTASLWCHPVTGIQPHHVSNSDILVSNTASRAMLQSTMLKSHVIAMQARVSLCTWTHSYKARPAAISQAGQYQNIHQLRLSMTSLTQQVREDKGHALSNCTIPSHLSLTRASPSCRQPNHPRNPFHSAGQILS